MPQEPLSSTHLSPAIPSYLSTRPRSTSTSNSSIYASAEDDSSDDDSVLSFWSSEEDSGDDAEIDESKEAERKQRELERQKLLATAGLQLRREPPVPPSQGTQGKSTERKVSRRRPAPAAPKRRRKAPDVPAGGSSLDVSRFEEDFESEPKQDPVVETQDAYARYEQFLSEASARPAPSARPTSTISAGSIPLTRVQTPTPAQTIGQGQKPQSPIAVSQPLSTSSSGGGRLSGFFAKMTGGQGQPQEKRVTPVITRVDMPGGLPEGTGEAGGGASGGGEDFGKTWASLVDAGVLSSMSERERKRQEVSSVSQRPLDTISTAWCVC